MAIHGVFARTEAWRFYLKERFQEIVPTSYPNADDPAWVRFDQAAIHADDTGSSTLGDPRAVFVDRRTPDADRAGAHLIRSGQVRHDADGTFAAVVLDKTTGALTLMRDPSGSARIFFRDEGAYVLFSTEAASLFEAGVFAREIDELSLVHYLRSGHGIRGRTLRSGVRSLPSGTTVEISADQPLRFDAYHSPLGSNAHRLGDEAFDDRLLTALTSACEDLRACSRPGLLLSGGLDSSLIAERCHAISLPLRTYTIDYVHESGPVDGLNESGAARTFAESLGFEHTTVPMTDADVLEDLETILSYPEPASAWTAVSHRRLCRALREDGCDAIVSGMGADELFGGYRNVWEPCNRLVAHGAGRPRATMTSLEWAMTDPQAPDDLFFDGVARFLKPDALRLALKPPFQDVAFADLRRDFYRRQIEIAPTSHAYAIATVHECQNRIPELLMAGFGPAHAEFGLTAAYPFLRGDIPQLVCALTAPQRFGRLDDVEVSKLPLRRLARSLLPDQVLARPRAAFEAPIGAWLRIPELNRLAIDEISRCRALTAYILDEGWVEDLLAQLRGMLENPGAHVRLSTVEHIWIVFTASAWANRWLD